MLQEIIPEYEIENIINNFCKNIDNLQKSINKEIISDPLRDGSDFILLAKSGYGDIYSHKYFNIIRKDIPLMDKREIEPSTFRELIVLKHISHSKQHNLICMDHFTYSTQKNCLSIYMKDVGISLFNFVRNTSFIDRMAHFTEIFLQVCSGVSYLHGVLKVTHGDIKLPNILYNGSIVKIIDYGFSLYKYTKIPIDLDRYVYMPPEVIRKSGMMGFSNDLTTIDMWSLGISMTEYLSGQIIELQTFYDKTIGKYYEPYMFTSGHLTISMIDEGKRAYMIYPILYRLLRYNPMERINIIQLTELIRKRPYSRYDGIYISGIIHISKKENVEFFQILDNWHIYKNKYIEYAKIHVETKTRNLVFPVPKTTFHYEKGDNTYLSEYSDDSHIDLNSIRSVQVNTLSEKLIRILLSHFSNFSTISVYKAQHFITAVEILVYSLTNDGSLRMVEINDEIIDMCFKIIETVDILDIFNSN